MRSAFLLGALVLVTITYCQTTSSKRGLVYIPSAKHPSDDNIWDSATSDLTWYYNYSPNPSPSFKNAPKLQFVPMLFSPPADISNTTFLDNVRQQISDGANITHVLTFNEPDGSSTTGGSNVPTDRAAQTWIREVEPLKQQGVKLGAPAVTGGQSGFTWLQGFFNACNGSCTVDFIPVHWYGNFEGLASHLGQVTAAYPNLTIWVTEYAAAGMKLEQTQTFYNQSSQYFDRMVNITRYSYFGSFRSDVSNVGPNAAMLTQDGALTDIGSWYLGGTATGKVPNASAAGTAAFAGSSLLVVMAAFWCLA